jgi:hypothetical protein
MDFRWKLPFIFTACFGKKTTAVRRTDFAGGFYFILRVNAVFSQTVFVQG